MDNTLPTTDSALAYADLRSTMPWMADHAQELRSQTTMDLQVLDVVLLDIACASAYSWAEAFDLPDAMNRLDLIQNNLRDLLVQKGLPYQVIDSTGQR